MKNKLIFLFVFLVLFSSVKGQIIEEIDINITASRFNLTTANIITAFYNYYRNEYLVLLHNGSKFMFFNSSDLINFNKVYESTASFSYHTAFVGIEASTLFVTILTSSSNAGRYHFYIDLIQYNVSVYGASIGSYYCTIYSRLPNVFQNGFWSSQYSNYCYYGTFYLSVETKYSSFSKSFSVGSSSYYVCVCEIAFKTVAINKFVFYIHPSTPSPSSQTLYVFSDYGQQLLSVVIGNAVSNWLGPITFAHFYSFNNYDYYFLYDDASKRFLVLRGFGNSSISLLLNNFIPDFRYFLIFDKNKYLIANSTHGYIYQFDSSLISTFTSSGNIGILTKIRNAVYINSSFDYAISTYKLIKVNGNPLNLIRKNNEDDRTTINYIGNYLSVCNDNVITLGNLTIAKNEGKICLKDLNTDYMADVFFIKNKTNSFLIDVYTISGGLQTIFNLQGVNNCEDYVIRLERLYSDGFKYVRDTFFDFNCQAIFYLKSNTIYKVKIIEENTGTVVYESGAFIPALSSYTIKISGKANEYRSFLNLYGYNINYNCFLFNQTIRCGFNNNDGRAINITIKVEKSLIFNKTTICEANISAVSGSIECNINNNKEVYVTIIWNDYNIILFSDVFTIFERKFVEKFNVFISLLIVLTLSFSALFNPFVSILMSIIGLIITTTLGLLDLSISTIIGLIIVLLLIKIKEII